MEGDELGDRMKMYEMTEASRKVVPLLPIMARIDGRAFHSFTRGMQRPFDERMMTCMRETARFLVQTTNAVVAYTQSDEIQLCWYSDVLRSQVFFNGRIQKMVSNIASLATVAFYRQVEKHLGQKYADKLPTFDCRVWVMPTFVEAANAFLWREIDATRNSILMLGFSQFSHKALHGLNTKQIQEKLWQEKQINWNDLPAEKKRGVWIQRKRVLRPFTAEDIEKLPPKHAARKNPDLQVERWVYEVLAMPPFQRVMNRVEVIFKGEAPKIAQHIPEELPAMEAGRA